MQKMHAFAWEKAWWKVIDWIGYQKKCNCFISSVLPMCLSSNEYRPSFISPQCCLAAFDEVPKGSQYILWIIHLKQGSRISSSNWEEQDPQKNQEDLVFTCILFMVSLAERIKRLYQDKQEGLQKNLGLFFHCLGFQVLQYNKDSLRVICLCWINNCSSYLNRIIHFVTSFYKFFLLKRKRRPMKCVDLARSPFGRPENIQVELKMGQVWIWVKQPPSLKYL